MILHYQFTGSEAFYPLWKSLIGLKETYGENHIKPEMVVDVVSGFDSSYLSEKDQLIFENFNSLLVLVELVQDGAMSIDGITNIPYSLDIKPDVIFPYMLFGQKESFADFWNAALLRLSKDVKKIHRQERKTNMLNGAIYKITLNDDMIVVGDIHGDICSLWQILKTEDFFDDEQKHIVFLGDYIDNGPHQLAALFLSLLLKVRYPGRVYLLKGNHEHLQKTSRNKIVPEIYGSNLFFHVFRGFLSHKCLLSIYNTLMDLPVVLEFNNKTGIVHGGLPRPTNDIDEYDTEINALDDLNNPDILYQMLWNRPADKSFPVKVSKATDFETSQPHFDAFMNKMGWDYMIRGHCPEVAGFNTLYDERMITIYSTGNAMSHYSYIRPVYAVLSTEENGGSPKTAITIKRVYKTDDMDHNVFAKELI